MLGSLVYKAVLTQQVYPLLWLLAPLAVAIILIAVVKERDSVPGVPSQKQKN
jgi:hypothetical protein